MYRIESCTLEGFRRMLLNNIRKITITPTMAVQLILGTNGCGKSSLIAQLSPWPAEAAAFVKGGSKVFKAIMDGRQYVCTSRFDSGAHHSFQIDGEEQNPGGTERVQRELVEKYFKVTQQTHDLMRGKEKFHAMAPAKRREWFTRMCTTDYTFAMSAFEKLKERANWLAGAARENKKNLVTETTKIMSDAEEAKLETEVEELLRELNLLTAERSPLGTSSAHHLNERSRALRALDDTSLRLLRNKIVVPLAYTDGRMERDDWGQLKRTTFQSVEEIDQELDRLKHIVTGQEAVLVTVSEQFNKAQRQHDILIRTGAEGVESLNVQIDTLQKTISAKVSSMRVGLVFTDAKAAELALESIDTPLTDAIRNLPVNSDRRYGRARHQELQEQGLKLVAAVNEAGLKVSRLVAQREHADQHRGRDKHTCPQCNHTWVLGVNEEQYQKLLEDIQVAQTEHKAALENHTDLMTKIKAVEGYFDQYREVMSFTKSVAVLKSLWDHLLESQLLFESPMEATSLVRSVKNDLMISVEVQTMEERIDELLKLRVQAAEVGDANLVEVRTQMDELTTKLGQLTSTLAGVSRAISDYSDYRRQLNTGIQLGEEVKRLFVMVENQQWEHVEALRRESIHHCIRQVEQALALKQESLRSVKMQKALVGKLQEQVAKNEIQEIAAKTMVKALSPTHGLIAEGLLGFIRNFVGQMNTFIARVWAYPLQVIPTGYDMENGEQSAELDYKFKMIVERETNIVPDVSLGSEGIVEMIDLAFKMVAIRQLGLADTPLFLDEFGKSFDDAHRFSATEEIRWMMENGNHPQLFMVSHYAASYSAFTNSEICVIDDRNIVIPSGREYNKHVHIVH
jgi:hypothetical protein